MVKHYPAIILMDEGWVKTKLYNYVYSDSFDQLTSSSTDCATPLKTALQELAPLLAASITSDSIALS